MIATEYHPIIRKYLSIGQQIGELPMQVVEEAMTAINKTQSYITRMEVAEKLQCTVEHVDRLTRLGAFTKYYQKGQPRFIEGEVNNYLVTRCRKNKGKNHDRN